MDGFLQSRASFNIDGVNVLGSLILGTRVSDTIWKDMVDLSMYRQQEKVLVFGYVSSLCGATIWLCIATVLKVPVSGMTKRPLNS